MRQLTLTGKSSLEWWDVPEPKLESDSEAIVRPDAVARCDLDLYMYLGVYTRPPPFAFGHEMAGTVTEVGAGVQSVAPGDRVVAPFQISCGACTSCRRGWTNACQAVPPLAAYGLGTHPSADWGGAFSDRVRVPFADAMLLPLPDSVSMETACGAGDNVSDGYRTVAPLIQRFPSEPVLVVGGLAQSVGLYAVMAALSLGAPRVMYVDYDSTRLAQAAALGAEVHVFDKTSAERTEDLYLISVDAAATAEGLAFALRSTAPCGYCTSVSGGLAPTTSLPLASMYLKGITYEVSRVHSRATLSAVLSQICCDAIDPLAIGARVLGFADAADSMGEADSKLIFSRESPGCSEGNG